MDPLDLVARITKTLPHRAGASLGWRVGQRASRRHRIARLRTGGRLVVDVGDYVHRPMFFLGHYEPATTNLFKRAARPGWTVLDVGANVGYFSVLAADLGEPGARVVAFEPHPTLYAMLAKSIELNPDSNILLERAAVADKAGQQPLFVSPEDRNSGLGTLRADLYATPSVTVPVVCLDDYCAEHDIWPDMLKIDVEGYEPQVLAGAEQLLKQHPPEWIICEVAPERDNIPALVERLAERGYAAHQIRGDGSLMLLQSCEAVHPNFENLCFARPR